MMRVIKLRLQKDMADSPLLAVGDVVLVVEPGDGIVLTPHEPTIERALAIAAVAGKRYRNTLRELAK